MNHVVLVVVFAVVLCFGQKVTPCSEFLRNHYHDFVENTRGAGCLNDTSLYFQWKIPSPAIFFGHVKEDYIELDEIMPLGEEHLKRITWKEYRKMKDFPKSDTKSNVKWINETQKDSPRMYNGFKKFIMYFDRISEEEFNIRIKKNILLQTLYKDMFSTHAFFSSDYGIYLKDDSTFFFGANHIIQSNCIGEVSVNGGKVVEHFCFRTRNCCWREINLKEYIVSTTDSTIRIDYSTGDWVLYNEKKDEIRFSVKDPLHNYVVTHIKKSGEIIDYTNLVPVLYCPGARYGLFGDCYL